MWLSVPAAGRDLFGKLFSVCFSFLDKPPTPDKQYLFKTKYGIISARESYKTEQKACIWRKDEYV